MDKKRLAIYAAALLAIIFLFPEEECTGPCEEKEPPQPEKPNDWFYRQRAFPHGEINYEAYREAFDRSQQMKQQAKSRGLRNEWQLVGPTNRGGRISAIAMHSQDMQTIYAGAASGGIFKSTNQGQTWEPVFDDAANLSIGDVDIAPSNPDILYVGTGESNAGGGSLTYDGIGVYKSVDAGESWQFAGLENSGSVGRVAIHPANSQTVFVAAMGRLFSNNAERGIYRTVNGGDTWEKVLYVSDSTGGIDVVIHPENPDTVYAAMWERIRRPERRSYGGPTSGIYRSVDGGDTWEELTEGLPSAAAHKGRIGIDISASEPNILYAIYADKVGYFQGIYKTADNGDSWFDTNDASLSGMYSSYGWWFGRIHVDPTNPEIIYPMGLDLHKSSSGGNGYSNISSYNVHVDQHDLYVHPQDPDFVVLGNDGGIYLSENAGDDWSHVGSLPITQFYTCEVDFSGSQERYYGGAQDLGTNRTLTGEPGDWENIYGGDGFYVRVDPENNDYVYAEYQYGNFARSTNGGNTFYPATSGIGYGDRMNWMTPYVLNPLNPSSIYLGTNKMYKSTNRAGYWNEISGDLTGGPGSGNLTYGTITTVAVSAADTNTLWVGTDDSHVWVSQNNGDSWENISAGIPERWVTRVAAHPADAATGYVCLSGYRYDSYQPHVFKTTNYGQDWQDISGDLPEAPVNDIIIDPEMAQRLYIATDFGMFYSDNDGENWYSFGPNLPNVPIVDLTLHNNSRTLVAATYGRSMYTYDLSFITHADQDNSNEFAGVKMYPNPFSSRVTIDVNQYEGKHVKIKVFDIHGKLVSELFRGEIRSTEGAIYWNPDEKVPSGVYVLQVARDKQNISRKVVYEKR